MSAYFSGASTMDASLPGLSIPLGSTMFVVFGKKSSNASLVQVSSGTTLSPFTLDQYGLHNISSNIRTNTNGRFTTMNCSLIVGDSVIVGASGDNSGLSDYVIKKPSLTCSTLGTTGTGATTSSFTDLRLGTTGTNSVEILEVVVYDGIITSNQFTCVLNYLENKYNYSTWV